MQPEHYLSSGEILGGAFIGWMWIFVIVKHSAGGGFEGRLLYARAEPFLPISYFLFLRKHRGSLQQRELNERLTELIKPSQCRIIVTVIYV